MGLGIVLDAKQRLRVAVTGKFDCETGRDLLRRFKMSWPARATAVHIDLKEVTEFHPGAIELLVLLLEMTNGECRLEGCRDEIQDAYVSVLVGAIASPGAGNTCRNFLTGGGAASCAREGCPWANDPTQDRPRPPA